VWKGRHFIGRTWAALSLATSLCGIILAEWMPNRDILVDWPGRRNKALKTGTAPAKTGRMVSLQLTPHRVFSCIIIDFLKNVVLIIYIPSGNPLHKLFATCIVSCFCMVQFYRKSSFVYNEAYMAWVQSRVVES